VEEAKVIAEDADRKYEEVSVLACCFLFWLSSPILWVFRILYVFLISYFSAMFIIMRIFPVDSFFVAYYFHPRFPRVVCAFLLDTEKKTN
jgi:hypothetical protein